MERPRRRVRRRHEELPRPSARRRERAHHRHERRLRADAGATARVSWKFIGLEGAVTGSFGAFRQVDARAELVLQGGIVELHGGYRARLVEVKDGEGVLVAGPTVALGLSF